MAIKSRFSEKKQEKIHQQIEEKSIAYDYRTKDYPFEVIVTKFGEKDDPNTTLFVPDYQRKYIWDTKQRSRFIESVLLGVPLTPFFVSEDNKGRLEIIDGSQRIRTLNAFYDNKFSLIGLSVLTEINKAKFKDLPSWHQRKIQLRDFRVIVVSDKADINIRRDIFNRINTSSEKLSDSEIRKGSYSGKFYNVVLYLKDNEMFRNICPVTKLKEERGEYEELILRFFAYTDEYLNFKHDVAKFLNVYLNKMNKLAFNRDDYIIRFNKVTDFINQYFPIGFRKEEKNNSTPRVRFEAIAVGTYLALEEQENLTDPNIDWLTSEGFSIQTTSGSSNNPNRLKNRVEFVRDALLDRLSDDRLQNG